MSTRVDVAIIGAGPAGSLAAWHLARAGRSVALFEKHTRPHHKVCGEFISPEGLPYLAAMGIDIDRHGAAVISHVRVHGPRHSFETSLPQPGRGISRLRLDELMIESAAREGAQVMRGEAVRSMRPLPGAGFEVATAARTTTAASIICATGKFDFTPVQARTGRDSSLVGFKLHLRLSPESWARLERHVDLFVFKGGYGGLAPVEDGLANLCFLLGKRAIGALGKDWPAMAMRLGDSCPRLAAYLAQSEPVFWPPVTVANVPYGFVRKAAVADNLYCVGDQLAVIPSFAGEGTTIAMMSAHRAARHITQAAQGEAGAGAEAFHAEMARVLEPQIKTGFRIHQLFKSPRLSDIGTLAARLWPGLADLIFRKTRSPSLEETLIEPA